MFVNCKHCDGNGFLGIQGFGNPIICPTCEGKKGFKIPDDKDVCPNCNGKGTLQQIIDSRVAIENPCDKCEGKGFVDKIKVDEHSKNENVYL